MIFILGFVNKMSLDSGFLPVRRKFWANLSHLQFKFKDFKQYLNRIRKGETSKFNLQNIYDGPKP